MNPYSYSLSTEKKENMSSTTEDTSTSDSTETKTSENKSAGESTKTAEINNVDKTIKKVKSKKDLKNDSSRFASPGVNFSAKLIGIDDVSDARGDKMCQESMYRLKMAVKQSGQHKQKIIINVSFEGIRIIDVRTQAVNQTHPVHRISFISRDVTDTRAFGYVYGCGDGKHKFFAIKTEKAAEALVLTLRDLFQEVYEMKKQEMEEAKHKIEEPAPETGTEAKENEEPVYSEIEVTPKKGQPVENGTEATYQVPTSNQPVETEADLLQMETELEVIERRIEQIDTMEELFKELEAPPPASTSQSKAPASSWASDLASLSQGMPQAQTSPLFTIGGVSFSSASQPYTSPSTAQTMFPGASQPFGTGQPYGQPFGAPTSQPGPFGQPAGGFGQQPFGGTANPFGAPSVPPRTGPGFAGPQPGGFPRSPFPASQPQQPGFPGLPGSQPSPSVPVTSDPFGVDPFANENPFGDDLLTPAKLEATKEATQQAKAPAKDAFGDLVNIGGTGSNLKPKDMFAELSKTSRKPLNELKVEKSPSPRPKSPGSQASGSPSGDNQQASDPFSSFDNPFGTADPFANDPFTSTAPALFPAQLSMQDGLFGGNVFGDDDEHCTSLPDEYNIPLPQCPPPPLPENIASHNHLPEPLHGPPPPPRPSVNTPPQTVHTPPLPPRPKSISSDSNKSSTSLNSLTESQPSTQLMPPLPPRPKAGSPVCNTSAVSRPRPRPRSSNVMKSPVTQTENILSDSICDSKNNVNLQDCRISEMNQTVNQSPRSNRSNCDTVSKLKISSVSSANEQKCSANESQKSVNSEAEVSEHRASSLVVDPFVSTDPFASEDPFTTADPFAHDQDPFASDPFSADPFTEDSNVVAARDDPFTTVVASPRNRGDTDPFSVFDKKLSSDSFKFEKSASRKVQVKVSGQ